MKTKPGLLSKLSLRRQLFISVVFIISIISTSYYFYHSYTTKEFFSISFKERTRAITEGVKLGMEIGLENEDFVSVLKAVNWAKRDSIVKFIAIYDNSNEKIVEIPGSFSSKYDRLSSLARVSTIEDSIFVTSSSWETKIGSGYLFIGFSTEMLASHERKSLNDLITTSIIILVIVLFIAVIISNGISKPLNRLKIVAQKISHGEYKFRVDESKGSKEVVSVATSFNKMIDKLLESQSKRLEEVNKFNESLEKRNQELVKLHYEKNEIMSIVAHDLKNPLAGIKITSSLLTSHLHTLPTDYIISRFQTIDDSVTMMTELISNLLDINSIESGKLKLSISEFNMAEVARAAINSFADAASRKHIEFIQDINSFVQAYGDYKRTRQVLDNLISNAIKFSPLGKSIFIRCLQGDTFARFEVEDQGPGITEEEMQQLYEKFARLSAKPTASETSTGLGLSIAKRLINDMGGEIWCESEFGKGAIFIIELPLATHTNEF